MRFPLHSAALVVFVALTHPAVAQTALDPATGLSAERQLELEERIRAAGTVRVTARDEVELVESPLVVGGALAGWVTGRDVYGKTRRRVSYPFASIRTIEVETPRPRLLRNTLLGAGLGLASGALIVWRAKTENERAHAPPMSVKTQVGIVSGFTIVFGAAGAAAGATRRVWETIYSHP